MYYPDPSKLDPNPTGPVWTRSAHRHFFTTVKPRVRLLKKELSSGFRVSCLATGFYPRHINLTLFRDGQPVSDHEITGGDLLPNGDGTYQMRKSLEISSDKHKYTCSATHLSLDNKLDVTLEYDHGEPFKSVIPSVLVVLALMTVFGAVAAIWKKRHAVKQANESVSSLARDVEELGKSSQKANSRFDSLHATRDRIRLGFSISFYRCGFHPWLDVRLKLREHIAFTTGGKLKPRTLIFNLLDYADRQSILKGAREAYPVKHMERILSFYPDLSNKTAKKRMEFNQVRKKMIALGLRPFLVYPAQLKLTHRGQPLIFKTPQEAEKFLDTKETPGTPLTC
ncbi:IgG receptor FcRn large subunit p51 [Anabarilius grahami]|uniref:IgG receptor FcRn large subunit p51 n=1 Tax=Anabarilius grahami TaxID=495550 RepID=A0A3N0YD89_ANAGA|nr:IgG receptor FcRn large subunit p51 [Anabarilius grahami]